jgi:hypothetical protein
MTTLLACPQCGKELAAAKLPATRIPAGTFGPFLYCPGEDLVVTLATGRPVPVPPLM